jgi:hypothetical protein
VRLEPHRCFAAADGSADVSVRKENAEGISLLANEFELVEHFSVCSARQAAAVPDFIPPMFERISTLEHHISCLDLAILPELQEFIPNNWKVWVQPLKYTPLYFLEKLVT